MNNRTLRAEILSIGDELLYGDIVDTNKPFIARALREIGICVEHFQTVGDDTEHIATAFELALSRADLVIASGGLGPTDDDLTVEALAGALGLPLEYREEVMDQMAERLKRDKSSFSSSNRKQANVPAGARVLRNHRGTAPGVLLVLDEHSPKERYVFLTPGVPIEMRHIYETYIEPFVRERNAATEVIYRKHLHLAGTPESRVGELLRHWMRESKNPDVGTRVKEGIITVRVVAKGPSRQAAEALAQPVCAEIYRLLGEHIFGEDEDDLQTAVVRALVSRELKLALAESCTAGMIASALGEVPGASETLIEGAVVYANEAKIRSCQVPAEILQRYGAVSEENACAMARGIRERTGTDLALSVTGIAGPSGGSVEKPVGTVWIGISTRDKTFAVHRLLAGYTRNEVRARTTAIALDLLRRTVLEL